MNDHNLHERISEVRLLLREQDISRATRRLLDLFVDFPASKELNSEALALRSEYNALSHDKDAKPEQREELARKMIHLLDRLEAAAPANAGNDRSTLGAYFTGDATNAGTNIVFEGKGITKVYSTGINNFSLSSIDLTLRLGELTGIVGENGNGKTTLLRIVAGDLAADGGTIEYPYFNLSTQSWYDRKHHIAYIPQRLSKWHGLLLDNLRFAAAIHGINGAENEERVDFIIERLGLSRFRYHKWSEVSSGYRLRFELAKMLVWRPRLLVLDEPLANLDINAQQLFLQDLKYIAKSLKYPVSILLSSQQLHEIESVSDNIIFLKAGEALYNGIQKDFGTRRDRNYFELAGSFNREELNILLSNIPGIRVEDSGTAFIVNTPIEVSGELVLQAIIDKKAGITYFRDISTSTKKLFRQEI